MNGYEAPGKLNLALHVYRPSDEGYHPLRSLVQTIEWCDLLSIDEGEGSDSLDIEGSHVEREDNLVLAALTAARREVEIPPLRVVLQKRLPVEAGLGGGSSDAAATLLAASDLTTLDRRSIEEIAGTVGADVTLFLTGGTLEMTGYGERIEPKRTLDGFAVAVAVPHFGLETGAVYRRWDEMEGPEGEPMPDAGLPPTLRGKIPMRNDLLPAAIALEPRLGDFMADVRVVWGSAVALTGSGSACFGYFSTVDEAADAASAVTDLCSVARGVALRDHGVARV